MGQRPNVQSTILVHPAKQARVVINREQGYVVYSDAETTRMNKLSDFDYVTPELIVRFYERRGYQSTQGVRLCSEPGCDGERYGQQSRCRKHYSAYQVAWRRDRTQAQRQQEGDE